MNIREVLQFHTRFNVGGTFFEKYADAVHDTYEFSGVTSSGRITLSRTHIKLIRLAQKQNILHAEPGFIRALRLTDTAYYFDVILRAIDGRIFSRGTSLILDEAVARAFGELYERVSMRFVPPQEKLIFKSYAALLKEKMPVIDIFDLPQTTTLQKQEFSEYVWDEHSEFHWVELQNFFTGEPTLVPAQLVYWGYKREVREPFLGELNTNGLGGGYSAPEAAISGTSEVLQRHSFFSFWYAKIAPPQIRIESILQNSRALSCKTIIQAVLEYGFTLHLLNCTLQSGTPSVTAVLTKPGMGWFLGMSTTRRHEEAIERAICEALSVYTWVMNDVAIAPVSLFDNHTPRQDFIDETVTDKARVHAWSREEIALHGSFLIEGETISFEDFSNEYAHPADEVLRRITGGQMFIKQAQQPYLDEVGFHSARIVAPKVYKLALHERFSTPVLGDLTPKNTYPHPFP